MLDFLPIPVTVNSTIEQESQFGFIKNKDQNIAQNNQNMAQNQMQLTNMFFLIQLLGGMVR